ncbi:MAG: hypothetical protein JXQ30_09740 [Spirochaetes bacterium]|nr:hypothetical protein [Spirochaetota bacterium]
MKRLEIIANASVEDSLFEAFRARGVVRYYTKVPVVHGIGSSGPRKGDHIWPEENFLLIIYCDEQEARDIREAVREVKDRFPDEGLKLGMIEECSFP